MLIGVPASGKSTWRENYQGDAVVISTDDLIEGWAAAHNTTYNDAFKDNIALATKVANERAVAAFTAGKDVIWDQTNITKKSRKSKLAMVPEHYRKTAVFFATPPEEEWQRRLNSRPGKSIPNNILMGMASSLEMPDQDEGWDTIDYFLNVT
jgi:predicted kinase